MNPTEAKRFHNELKAARIAGVPIEIDEEPDPFSRRLSLKQLDELKISNPNPSNSNSDDARSQLAALSQAIATEQGLPKRFQAALQVFDQTGSMVPVLDGLSVQCISRQQVSRVMRRAFIYLIVLSAVAVSGLLIFKSRIAPFIVELRIEIAQSGSTKSEQFDLTQWLALIITVIGCMLVLFAIWTLFGRASRIAIWLGGDHYLRCRTSASAIRTLQLLLDRGLPVNDAVSICCDLTGADKRMRKEVESAVQNSQSAQNLYSLSDYLSILASQRLESMRVTAPTTLICSVGGIVALVYCVAIFWPIIALLKDLMKAGI